MWVRPEWQHHCFLKETKFGEILPNVFFLKFTSKHILRCPTKAIFVYPDPLMWRVPGLLQLAEGRGNHKGCAKIIFLISIIEDLKKNAGPSYAFYCFRV